MGIRSSGPTVFRSPGLRSTIREDMDRPISIAIETSCRRGGVAFGAGDKLLATDDFDASLRHGAQLVRRLDDLLAARDLRAADLDECYVSVGPGSFTGTRIGVTVARTLAQAVPALRCLAVNSPAAVAEEARETRWEHLAVVLDAREGLVHATLFDRRDGHPEATEALLASPADVLAAAPRPLTLLGEGLGYHDLSAEGVTIPEPDATDRPPHVPTARGVWRLGRRLAAAGRFTPAAELLPAYARKPEAVRLWERRKQTTNASAGD